MAWRRTPKKGTNLVSHSKRTVPSFHTSVLLTRGLRASHSPSKTKDKANEIQTYISISEQIERRLRRPAVEGPLLPFFLRCRGEHSHPPGSQGNTQDRHEQHIRPRVNSTRAEARQAGIGPSEPPRIVMIALALWTSLRAKNECPRGFTVKPQNIDSNHVDARCGVSMCHPCMHDTGDCCSAPILFSQERGRDHCLGENLHRCVTNAVQVTIRDTASTIPFRLAGGPDHPLRNNAEVSQVVQEARFKTARENVKGQYFNAAGPLSQRGGGGGVRKALRHKSIDHANGSKVSGGPKYSTFKTVT